MKIKTRILVVDDNFSLRDTFGLIFKRKGYDVDTAADGLSAVDKFRGTSFDVVIMDIVMPRMNGVEALHKIKEIDSKTKVILMTAYSGEKETHSAKEEGAYRLLSKPVDIAQLMDLIKEATSAPTILLVDDDDDFCRTLGKALELNGYNVQLASSGQEAIKVLRERRCSIAIVDLKMPRMDGMETFLKLKEIDSDLKAIMMTGYRDEMSKKMEIVGATPVNACLYKPFNPAELVSLLSQLNTAHEGGNNEGQRDYSLSR